MVSLARLTPNAIGWFVFLCAYIAPGYFVLFLILVCIRVGIISRVLRSLIFRLLGPCGHDVTLLLVLYGHVKEVFDDVILGLLTSPRGSELFDFFSAHVER